MTSLSESRCGRCGRLLPEVSGRPVSEILCELCRLDNTGLGVTREITPTAGRSIVSSDAPTRWAHSRSENSPRDVADYGTDSPDTRPISSEIFGREPLFEDLDDWIQTPHEPVYVLWGTAGSGKREASVAWLQRPQAPEHHLLIDTAGSRNGLGCGRVFSQIVSLLTAAVPEFGPHVEQQWPRAGWQRLSQGRLRVGDVLQFLWEPLRKLPAPGQPVLVGFTRADDTASLRPSPFTVLDLISALLVSPPDWFRVLLTTDDIGHVEPHIPQPRQRLLEPHAPEQTDALAKYWEWQLSRAGRESETQLQRPAEVIHELPPIDEPSTFARPQHPGGSSNEVPVSDSSGPHSATNSHDPSSELAGFIPAGASASQQQQLTELCQGCFLTAGILTRAINADVVTVSDVLHPETPFPPQSRLQAILTWLIPRLQGGAPSVSVFRKILCVLCATNAPVPDTLLRVAVDSSNDRDHAAILHQLSPLLAPLSGAATRETAVNNEAATLVSFHHPALRTLLMSLPLTVREHDKARPYVCTATGQLRLLRACRHHWQNQPESLPAFVVAEFPRLLQSAGELQLCWRCLTSLSFIRQKLTAGLTDDYLADVHALTQSGTTVANEEQAAGLQAVADGQTPGRPTIAEMQQLDEIGQFVRSRRSHLEREPTAIAAMARNSANQGPLATAGEQQCQAATQPWIARDPRPFPPDDRVPRRQWFGHIDEILQFVATPANTTDSRNRRAVTASRDGTIGVWSLSPMRLLHRLPHPAGAVTALALSADGSTLAHVGGDRVLRVWNLADNSSQAVVPITWAATSLALDANGRCAIIGSIWKDTLQVWDIRQAKLTATLTGVQAGVLSVTFAASESGSTGVWATDYAGHVLQWELPDSTAVTIEKKSGLVPARKWHAHTDGTICAAVSECGQHVLTGGFDHAVMAWDTRTGSAVATWPDLSANVTCVDRNIDGSVLVWGTADGTLTRMEQAGEDAALSHRQPAGTRRISLAAHDGAVIGVCLVNGGAQVVSAGADGVVCRHDFAPTGQAAAITADDFAARPSKSHPPAASPLSSRATEVRDVPPVASNLPPVENPGNPPAELPVTREIKPPSLAVNKQPRKQESSTRLPRHRGPVRCIVLGTLAVTAGQDGAVCLWDPESSRVLRVFRGHTRAVTALTWDTERKQLVSAGSDGSVRLWHAESGELQESLDVDNGEALCLTLTEEDWLVLVGDRGQVTVWDLNEDAHRQFGGLGNLSAAAVVDSDDVLLVGDAKGILSVWDLEEGTRLHHWPGQTGEVATIAVSPDEAFAVTAGRSGVLQLWETENWRLVRELSGHRAAVASARFSSDGTLIVSGCVDGTVFVHDRRTGQRVAAYYSREPVLAVSQIRSNGRFACGTADGSVHFLGLRYPREH